MVASLLHWLRWRCEAKHRNGPGLWTAVEANAAAGATLSGVAGGMHAVGTQLRGQFQALGRAGLDAQPASFALFYVDGDLTARLCRHVHLATEFASTSGRCSHFVCSQYAYNSSRNLG